MKKAFLGICALVAALSLAACGGAPASSQAPASQPASVSQPASEPASESAADYTAYTIQFDVPEGFVEGDGESAGVSAIYQAEDGSSVNVVIMEDDGSLASDVDENTMVALLESSFSEQMGSEVTLENVAFTTDTLAGICPYYRLDYTITLNGVTMNQTVLGINADRAYTITYTDMTGGDWAEDFETSIASITPVEQ